MLGLDYFLMKKEHGKAVLFLADLQKNQLFLNFSTA